MVQRDIQRIMAVIENRKFIEQSGTQEHEMYIDFDDLNFTLYTGEGICGFLSDESKVILGIDSNDVFPVYVGGKSDADEQYFAYRDEGLNMYDTGEYGQARWDYLDRVLKVLTLYLNKCGNNMFGLSIVKTAELQALQNTVSVLGSDLGKLEYKYNSLADQVQRSDKATREQLSALAKPKTCPVFQQTPKHVTDPVGAWESKQRVLEVRLKSASDDVELFERQQQEWRGVDHSMVCFNASLKRKAQEQVEQLKQNLYEHQTRKPVVVQLPPPSETAVFVQHKKYNTLGLLKGNHITILSKGNQLDVGDVILNATPTVVYKFWDIVPNVESVNVHV